MPSNNDTYLVSAADNFQVNAWDNFYINAYQAWNPFYPMAATDLEFYLGNQWQDQEEQALFEEGRSPWVWNRLAPNIDWLVGYFIEHQLSPVCIPQEDKDQEAADEMTQLLLYVFEKGRYYEAEAKAFGGACKTGWNLLNIWMDYRTDPEGDICFSRDPYSGFIVDPYFTRLDFQDCEAVGKRKYISLPAAKSLLPKHQREVERLYYNGWSRDSKFTWLPYQVQPDGHELLAYDEFHRMRWKSVPLIVDRETNSVIELPSGVDKRYLRQFLEQTPSAVLTNKQVPYVECNIIVNGVHIDTIENQFGLDEYPFAPMVAIFEPESYDYTLKVQSKIRRAVGPQKQANRTRIQMIDIIESQINSGWIADENSVINPRALQQTGQGKVVFRSINSRPNSVERLQPAQIPPSFFGLTELMDRDIDITMGITDSLKGITDNPSESGLMYMMRQAGGLVGQQELMNNARTCQECIARKAIKLIQTWSPQKIQRILGKPPVQDFMQKNFLKFDIQIGQGMRTHTQKMMYFRQLLDLKQAGGIVTPEMLSKAAPLQGKSEYNQEVQQIQQQQAQAQQMQQQLGMAELQTRSQLSQAKALSETALAKERLTRSIANIGLEEERNAKAVDDRADAALNRIRAIKELQSIDDDTLIKYLDLIYRMEQNARQQEKVTKAEDVAITQQIEPSTAKPAPGGMQ